MPAFMEIYHQTIMIMSQLHRFFSGFFSLFFPKEAIHLGAIHFIDHGKVKGVGCELRPTEDGLPSNRGDTIEINEAA